MLLVFILYILPAILVIYYGINNIEVLYYNLTKIINNKILIKIMSYILVFILALLPGFNMILFLRVIKK